MNKEETIKRYGKGDGLDEDRYLQACEMSRRIDKPVFLCFEGLVNLEKKGLIEMKEPTVQATAPEKLPEFYLDTDTNQMNLKLPDDRVIRYPTLETFMLAINQEITKVTGEMYDEHGPEPDKKVLSTQEVQAYFMEIEERLFKRLGIQGVEGDCEEGESYE